MRDDPGRAEDVPPPRAPSRALDAPRVLAAVFLLATAAALGSAIGALSLLRSHYQLGLPLLVVLPILCLVARFAATAYRARSTRRDDALRSCALVVALGSVAFLIVAVAAIASVLMFALHP